MSQQRPQFRLDVGSTPWRPNSDIDDVEVLASHNGRPMIGLMETESDIVMFWHPIDFDLDDYSLWLYVPIDQKQAQELADGARLESVLLSNPGAVGQIGVAEGKKLLLGRQSVSPMAKDLAEWLVTELTGFSENVEPSVTASRLTTRAKAGRAISRMRAVAAC